MIPDRLPWRHRARPSATLHEIQVRSPVKLKSELVPLMLQNAAGGVKGKVWFVLVRCFFAQNALRMKKPSACRTRPQKRPLSPEPSSPSHSLEQKEKPNKQARTPHFSQKKRDALLHAILRGLIGLRVARRSVRETVLKRERERLGAPQKPPWNYWVSNARVVEVQPSKNS
jgi:hypothetical protein